MRLRPILGVLLAALPTLSLAVKPQLSPERLVFQTSHGDIHMAFYHNVAPKTARLISTVGSLGGYTTNHFFRVDKGFVAQTAGIVGGRTAPMDDWQEGLARATVPLETDPEVKHDRRGILSLARGSDPGSGGTSFSILLGPAPHLDGNYAIFGEVTRGLETLTSLEAVETRKEGIFVMPLERIEILSSYMYVVPDRNEDAAESMPEWLDEINGRYLASTTTAEKLRNEMLPGN